MTLGKMRITSCALALLLGFAANGTCWAQAQTAQSSGTNRLQTDSSLETKQEESDNQGELRQPSTTAGNYDNSLGIGLVRNLVSDQRRIWTSPARLRLVDADWLVPLGVATGAMLATDTETSKHISNSPSRLKRSQDFSNYGIAAMAAASGGMYLWGRVVHNEHKRETGFLAGEAALNAVAVDYALKYSLGRERPLVNNYQGEFWKGGDSFPSMHANVAWAVAGVFAHEYPGPLPALLSYGLATGISAARVTGKQHFPSDVLVGSAIGWFIGQEVYRHHHNPEVGGGDWKTYGEWLEEKTGAALGKGGSPYVELDSWVYPAIERLAGMGYIHSEFLGMRPWTRLECANLVEEAGEIIRDDGSAPAVANELYGALETEFSADRDTLAPGHETYAKWESLYAGFTSISGPPLNDSYHFGQTIINNYGRPYQEGFNTYDGFSAYATAGRFTAYVRGEFQHSPSAPAYPLTIRQAIATMDANPLQPATPIAAVNRFELLDTYVAANVANWNFAFGKQSLWWGPGKGGDLIYSNNAAPIYMFRASRVSPFTLPLISKFLGPMKFDFFYGKLSGHEFPARPMIHGEKISFKPTPNLELGFSRTTVFSGEGRAPLTLGLLNRTYFSIGNGPGNNVASDFIQNDPGDRHGGFDFSYRVPYLRNWLTVYSNSLAEDDPSPLANLYRAAFNPGIYLSHVPLFPRLDLRVESVYTDVPNPETTTGGFFVYFNSNYHDSYTNKSDVLGSWIGREGKGFQGWITYWASGHNSIQLGYLNAKVSKDFVPDGETMSSGSMKTEWWIGSGVKVVGAIQYGKWLAPILASDRRTNWTTSIHFVVFPGWNSYVNGQ